MRLLLIITFLNVSFVVQSQKLSDISNEITFTIREGKIAKGYSNPTKIILGENIPVSGVSPPIYLKLGYKSISGISNNIALNLQTTADSEPLIIISDKEQETTPEKEVSKLTISSVPKYYSLIIGVNDYQNNSEELRNLKKPIADATQLQKILIEDYNFKKEYSALLTNPTRKEVLNHLEELAKELTDKDNLLIFYAGHGIWDERLKVGYWIPSDGEITNKSNWLSNSTIRDYIAGINSKHTLLISDACFSGSIFTIRGSTLSNLGMSSLYRLPSRKAMTSGTLTTVPDESKFMHYLIKRLNEYDGEYLSAKQLFYSIETPILNNTNTVPQFGTIQDTGDEGGDFIFIKE